MKKLGELLERLKHTAFFKSESALANGIEKVQMLSQRDFATRVFALEFLLYALVTSGQVTRGHKIDIEKI